MALRIRLDGRIFCAARRKKMKGDIYIDDTLHYEMSVVHKVLVTTPMKQHKKMGGEWWWKGREPKDVIIDEFYYSK